MKHFFLALGLLTACATYSSAASLAAPPPGQKWAVIVGVTEYNSDCLDNLQWAVSDANGLRDTLTASDLGGLPADHVVKLTSGSGGENEPTAANIRKTLTLIAKKTRPQDTIWFYFSGHGYDKDGLSYLLTPGFRLSALTTLSSCISTTEIRKILLPPSQGGACLAERKIIVIDACHSGSSKGIHDPAEREKLLRGQGMVTLAACSTNQSSWEFDGVGGVFTHFLRLGLSGDADYVKNGGNGDGSVSAQEIANYITSRVDGYVYEHTDHSNHQTPVAIMDGSLTGIKLTINNPAEAERLLDPNSIGAHLVHVDPVSPGVILAFDETTTMPDGKTIPEHTTESLLRGKLLDQAVLVYDEEAARRLHSSLQSKDLHLVAAEVSKTSASYVLRGSATVNTQSLPSFQGPDGLTVQMYNATATVSAELVDKTGKVLQSATVNSGQEAGSEWTPASTPTSANPERAASIAIADAVAKLSTTFVPAIRNLSQPPSSN